LAPF